MNDFIRDKAPQPQGLLPKNVQSWLIVSLAVLMVAIMWLTGSKKQSQARTAGTLSQAMSPVEVDGTKITEMQGRIQQLQREQLVAQNALTQQNRILGNASDPSHATAAQPERAEDAIEAERKKRKYLSLFASNVALTYRKQAQPTTDLTSPSAEAVPSSTVPSTSAAMQFAQFLKDMQPTSPLPAAVSPPVRSAPASPAESEQNKKEVPFPAAVSTGAAVPAAGKTYVLFEGTILETVLLNRLDGAFAGPIECLVTGDVYSLDRQHVLIPAGSKVLGETRKVEAFGQARLAVIFHRLLMPDGYSVSLDQFKGLNQSGDTGLRDQVNNHYLRIFGASLAIGALGAVAEADTGGLLTQSGTDPLREGFGQSMARSSEQILDRFLNLLPTITIREGHRVKIYLSGDLALPDDQHHNLPTNL
jgi:type IV secretory pathway VirB10-like protein